MNKSNQNGKHHILIVDDEPLVRNSLREMLTFSGYAISVASNGKEALQILEGYTADVIITDIKMPEMDGVQLLKKIRANNIDAAVILMTGYGSIENAVAAMKEGAYDYITKPILDNEIKIVIERLINQRQLQEENRELKKQLLTSTKERFLNITGRDPKMQKIYSLIEAIAKTRATVLICGESGTGKHIIAHAIHDYDPVERKKPFIEVGCGALTETLLESELFGHVKGAFTGAIKDKAGRFELAHGGTLFLDEIDAFSSALQMKLLRVLESGEFERVGETKTLKADARIIAATNQRLEELIAQGKFRQDLYYRLNIINIDVPPLRERKSDIELLANDFIDKHSKRLAKKIQSLAPETLSILMHYHWPGNVRELENVIERAIILSKGPVITPEDLPDFFHKIKTDEPGHISGGNGNGHKLKDALKDPEKDIIVKALEAADWNRNKAAEALGINRTTLYKKMVRFNLLKDAGRK